jgi:hypothetical protein
MATATRAVTVNGTALLELVQAKLAQWQSELDAEKAKAAKSREVWTAGVIKRCKEVMTLAEKGKLNPRGFNFNEGAYKPMPYGNAERIERNIRQAKIDINMLKIEGARPYRVSSGGNWSIYLS